MRGYKTHYWVRIDDNRWYDHKLKWWVDYNDRKGNCSFSRTVYTMKKVMRILKRFYHENYKGIVTVIRFMNYSDKKGGHLTEEFTVDYSDKYKNEKAWLFS